MYLDKSKNLIISRSKPWRYTVKYDKSWVSGIDLCTVETMTITCMALNQTYNKNWNVQI